jgi:alkanesulfonate monooxygenase SsuD/methylene tetrahydromethanopterin reductase-like flavin-dependent oxidoreductase (luciferase family)
MASKMLDNFGPGGDGPVVGGRSHMDFVFMLTRSDQTVTDCLETWDAIADVGLTHAGFKDIGVDLATLRQLNQRIQASGATSYLEVVSETPEACLQSARVAVDIGVNRLMGGTQVDEILALLDGTGIEYLPFPGLPVGHPTKLGGTPELVVDQCRAYEAAGCAGVDLLAYRATDADPIDLVRAARSALSGTLLAAGSVDSIARIEALHDAGADAFTIGSAIFDGSFSPHLGSITARLRAVLEVCQ